MKAIIKASIKWEHPIEISTVRYQGRRCVRLTLGFDQGTTPRYRYLTMAEAWRLFMALGRIMFSSGDPLEEKV